MRISACAFVILAALTPASAWAQSASAADKLRTVIRTKDLERQPEMVTDGGPTTLWRFSTPDRLSIEEWLLTTAVPIRREVVWRGRYEFRGGKFCLKGDNEPKSRCFSIELRDAKYEWKLEDEKEDIRLGALDRADYSKYLKPGQK